MKNRSGIPWFVFENRHRDEPKHDPVQERRAAVITILFMTMLLGLILLAACYCRTALVIIIGILTMIGMAASFRAVYRYCKGA